MDENILKQNYVIFLNQIKSSGINPDEIDKKWGNEIIRGTFSDNTNTGTCFEGAYLCVSLDILRIAYKIMKSLPEEIAPDEKKLVKVCLLSNLSKISMFSPTTEEWKKKRGIYYDFTEYPFAFKTGMRSLMMLQELGISMDCEETEAMLINDKDNNDLQSMFHSTMLSSIVRSAYDIICKKYRILYGK
jgi:hypothetical protein